MGKIKTTPKRREKNGIQLIAAERRRQVEKEGFDAAHDDLHTNFQLGVAAATYALHGGNMFEDRYWPFGERWLKFGDISDQGRIRDLIKAGALCAAEIDRLKRKIKKGEK